ncbi:MAG TPA: GtrA family protein [Pseudonocardia sp.]|nr:GtrA family protein [Pseudonocardia sp.]
MAGAALATHGSPAGVPDSWRARMRRHHPLLVQVLHYMVVGGLGTGVNAAVFLAVRTGLDAVPANLVALVVSTAVSTEAHRRFTFPGGAAHPWRAQAQVGGTVLFYAFYSSAVLVLLELLVDAPSPAQESLAVAAASVLGGTGRFLLMRYWVFDGARTGHAESGTGRVDTWDERA